MQLKKGMSFGIAAMLCMAVLACQPANLFVAQATLPPTRTPRPTFTPIPPATNTFVPTQTASPAPTATATKRPTLRPTAKPPTPIPQPAVPPPPTVSAYEFHANPPLQCTHSGHTFLKGTVYLDKNNPNSKYVGAIVALGPPNGSTIYTIVMTDIYGQYTFTLSDEGQSHPGTWAIWLVDPSNNRKSDISASITTNSLGADDPNSCWAGGVDFWK
jgi:hypothetical protein